jgi:hypothetical protein
MSDGGTVETIIPWTIKAISKAARDTATDAARREGLTVGQWLERRINEWQADGSPVSVAAPPPSPVNLGDLARAMEAVRALSADAGVAVPQQLARDGQGLIRKAIRQAKGLPPPQRREKAPQALLEG